MDVDCINELVVVIFNVWDDPIQVRMATQAEINQIGPLWAENFWANDGVQRILCIFLPINHIFSHRFWANTQMSQTLRWRLPFRPIEIFMIVHPHLQNRLTKKRKIRSLEERQAKKRKLHNEAPAESRFTWGITGESLPLVDPELPARLAAEAAAAIERSKAQFLRSAYKLPSAAIMVLMQQDHYTMVTGRGEAVPNQPSQAP